MPELPEVETVVRDLRRLLPGRTICAVDIYWAKAIATPGPGEFAARVCGQRITGVDRRGKFIVLHLERDELLVHLRMTGQLLLVPASEEPDLHHLRVALTVDGQRLLFNDARKFGRMYLVREADAVLGQLGPEPLEAGFTVERLAGCLRGRRGPIKSVLVNQKALAGIGNIYADEVLHAAGVAPQRPADSLSPAEIRALHAAIRGELERAIRNRGTTFRDYRDAQGRPGGYLEHLRVYGRGGERCQRCGDRIACVRIGGRSSYHCPRCQR